MNFSLNFTASKLLSFIIAICSAAYGFIFEDGDNMVIGFGIAASLYANKQYQDRKKTLNIGGNEK